MAQMDEAQIAQAGAILRDGGLIGLPTETVYGLAADATNDDAVARIFEAKGRPRFNPLIVHIAQPLDVFTHAIPPSGARRLMEAFWPGPLTLVLPRRPDAGLSLLVSAGLDTLAMRMPAHPLARAVITAAGRPIAAPSANPSGGVSPTCAAHVRAGLGDAVRMVLEGGASAVGVESTIVKLTDSAAFLLRPGGLAREEIEDALGARLVRPEGRVEAPGMMASHYAPSVGLRMNADTPAAGEFFLGFGAVMGEPGLNLSAAGDVREAAANLFRFMREADDICARKDLVRIAVAPVPMTGLGEAINDRLRRAAAPRG